MDSSTISVTDSDIGKSAILKVLSAARLRREGKFLDPTKCSHCQATDDRDCLVILTETEERWSICKGCADKLNTELGRSR